MHHITSLELCKTALFSAILTVVELISFSCLYPVLPPIVVVPFVTSFVLAMSIPFVKRQWLISFIAGSLVVLRMGNLLPGPLIIPLYGLIFQTGKVKLSGALSASVHVVYGIFLAPLIFSVAPARILYKACLQHLHNFVVAVGVVLVLFGVGGFLAAGVGYKLGVMIAKTHFHLGDKQHVSKKLVRRT